MRWPLYWTADPPYCAGPRAMGQVLSLHGIIDKIMILLLVNIDNVSILN